MAIFEQGLAVSSDKQTIYATGFVGRVRRQWLSNFGDFPLP